MTKNNSQGFTLIELVIYLAIAAFLLLAINSFLKVALETRAKNQTIAEIENQGQAIMSLITQTVRNASSITVPTAGASLDNTSLVITDLLGPTSQSPTIFDLNNGKIRIKEGAAAAIELNNTLINATNLSFYNVSRTGTYGALKIQFTLTHVNQSKGKAYRYSRTFYGSATLRQ